ncbi:MAG TPA: AAA family ATPase, partial [Ktedonobacteraceae bacterium]|nr:AAA family ATPase [Ktedonobacteraceae bacterium]
MGLLERDHYLDQLAELLRTAATGQGRTVLISGEAGIGKTALVEQFVSLHSKGARLLWGACEALFTPRPLGPLYDIAMQIRGRLSTLLDRDTGQAALFSAFLEELQKRSRPSIVVFEDIHWADEATLDLIKFLGRRILDLPVLFLVTYRDTELSHEHPLQFVFGDLPGKAVVRYRLTPLSEQAVSCLATQAQRSAEGIYAATLGNPFFVAEVLASDREGVPLTVRDAVVARVARLSASARALLELTSVIPTRSERWLLDAILGSTSEALDECLTNGMLDLSHMTVAFRHELARQAVESTLSPLRKQAMHGQVLQALLSHGAGASQAVRLVHHATGAQDEEHVLRYAPLAARHAAAQGAHRQAADHYRKALEYADRLDAAGQQELHATLLEELANECSLTSQAQEAFQAHAAALELWRSLKRTTQVGHTLYRLSEQSWRLGRSNDSYRYAVEAVEFLETLPPGRELGQAYANLSSQYMVSSNTAQTLIWGKRALEVARQFHDTRTECYALFSIGSTTFCSGKPEGRDILENSLHMALDQGFEEIAALSYVNLANALVRGRSYTMAMDYLYEGIAYCREHDLDTFRYGILADLARARLDQGDWSGAEEDATAILRAPGIAATNRIPALLVLGLVLLRRGDPGAQQVLDEARDLARNSEMQDITPVAAARAEWYWLQEQPEQCIDEATRGFQLALPCQRPWYLGEVAIWLWRMERLPELPEGAVSSPFALQIAGDWQGAAALWEQLGCPYEQALALVDGDTPAQLKALAMLEQLGAQPAVTLVRRRLRQQGVAGIPRGARLSTRSNQAGLTNRQLEVLQLMAEGLSNTEIASRLITSPKTVEHHVSAILAKLGVHSRAQ